MTYTIATPVPGQPASASLYGQAVIDAVNDLDSRLAALDNMVEGSWVNFNSGFQLTGTTTDPVQVGGTKLTRYRKIGKTVQYKGIIVFGVGSSFGSGAYQLNYPITPASIANTNGGFTGAAYGLDNSTGANHVMAVVSWSTTVLRIVFNNPTGSGSLGSAGLPSSGGWDPNGDRFSWDITYDIP